MTYPEGVTTEPLGGTTYLVHCSVKPASVLSCPRVSQLLYKNDLDSVLQAIFMDHIAVISRFKADPFLRTTNLLIWRNHMVCLFSHLFLTGSVVIVLLGAKVPIRVISRWYFRDIVINRLRAH